MAWSDLADDRDRWWALVNVVMDLRVPPNAGHFLTSWGMVSFSRRLLLHGVSMLFLNWEGMQKYLWHIVANSH